MIKLDDEDERWLKDQLMMPQKMISDLRTNTGGGQLILRGSGAVKIYKKHYQKK
jgi:hypothetical protein